MLWERQRNAKISVELERALNKKRKYIKSGTLQVGAEIVVNFNGKSEDARIAVLSGECTYFTFR